MTLGSLGLSVTLAFAPPAVHDPELEREGRQELIAGITLRVLGTAAFYAGMGVRGVGEGPGFGLYRSEAEMQRELRIHAAMSGVALTGTALMIAGAVLIGVGINRLYRSRGVALHPGGVSLRF
jgi:hypothetical protein